MNLTYSDAIQFLYDLRLFGTKLGLENTLKLAEAVGNPHHNLRFIHVAGTNGKGSTCAMLESIYRLAGLKTALYTSPHLVSFRERIQINRELISEADVIRLVSRLSSIIGHWPHEACPTFFEVVTVMAMAYFAENQCELVIWETGMGGRLDATNIVTPLASVITNIDLDHQKWLGDSVEMIAAEKAGIIKRGVPVVTGEHKPEALKVIRETSDRVGAPLTVTNEAEETEYALALVGQHQHANAALAVTTVGTIANHIPVNSSVIMSGLENVDWPGRFQVVRLNTCQTIILDGAHNPAGAAALRNALVKHFPAVRSTFIIGVMRDKDWGQMCELLAPLAAEIWFVPVASERTADPETLRSFVREITSQTEVHVASHLNQALEALQTRRVIVVTGSLHLIGEAMELLHMSPVPARSERELNEWKASP